jgi:3-hydroxyisobutyrate dehydrogenase-like beta-hydroxyacid dehydrogenase
VTPTVAIIAPGNMGAGVAARLAEHKVTVLTMLAGRSAASASRARAAGMKEADERQLMEADFLLSIVPPGEALALAKRLAPLLAAASRKPVYVDCNAVSPATMTEIAETVSASAAPFAAAGIIGPPPKPGSNKTKFYASGPAAPLFAGLNDHGLVVRPLDGPLTAASALKMSYAGITKGFTALGVAMMLAATREGAADALKTELAESQQALLGWLTRQTPNMYAKAYRWVAELDEIAAFVGSDKDEDAMLTAAARLYERIAADYQGDRIEIATLDAFMKPPAKT